MGARARVYRGLGKQFLEMCNQCLCAVEGGNNGEISHCSMFSSCVFLLGGRVGVGGQCNFWVMCFSCMGMRVGWRNLLTVGASNVLSTPKDGRRCHCKYNN